MNDSNRRISVRGVTYLIDLSCQAPLSRGWEECLARQAADHPSAIVWDDLLIQRDGSKFEAMRLRWPNPDPLFYSQVTHVGRCAIREDFIDPSQPDTSSHALTELAARGERIDFASDILRFTGAITNDVYTPRHPPPEPPNRAGRISVIINYRDRPELMEKCLASIARQRLRSTLEVMLINNQSTAENLNQIATIAERALVDKAVIRHLNYDESFNKSAQDNLGVASATGEITVMMNNDAILTGNDTLQSISDWAASPGIASAGPRFTGARGRLVSSGVFIRKSTPTAQALIRENELPVFAETVHHSSGSSFACAAVSKSAWAQIGPLDTRLFTSQYNDADFFLRALRVGLKHVYVGNVTCHHEPGRTEVRTKIRVLSLLDKLRERYPDMGDYSGADPDLVKEKRLSPFDRAHANLKLLAVRVSRARNRLRQHVKRPP